MGHKEFYASYLGEPHSVTAVSREASVRSSTGDLAGPEAIASLSPNWGYIHIDMSTSTSPESQFQYMAHTSFTRTSDTLNACLPTISS